MKKIACIGNVTYDMIGYTKTFPIEDRRNTIYKKTTSLGGPSFNAASVLEKFNEDVSFYGFIGDDDFSELLMSKLNETNINRENLVKKENFSMPFSFIIVTDDSKSRTINTNRDPQDNIDLVFDNYSDDYDIILTDGKYPKAFFELQAKNPTATTIIDAGRCNENIINICKNVDYIICSEDFANDFVKTIGINKQINFENINETLLVMEILNNYFEKSNVCATVGSKGYLYFDDNNNLINKEALSFGKVLDTTAAGDIFHGAFTYALANDYSYEQSLEFANTTSSLSVTKYGGRESIPSLDEVKSVYNKVPNQKKLILKK